MEVQSYQTAVRIANAPSNSFFQNYNREVIGANASFTHAYRFINLPWLRVYGGPTGVLGASYQDVEPLLADKFPLEIARITLGLGGKLTTYWHLNDAWAITAGIRLVLFNMAWSTEQMQDPTLTMAQNRNSTFDLLVPRPELYAPLGVTYFFGT